MIVIAAAYFMTFILLISPPDARYERLAPESQYSELTGTVLDDSTGAPVPYANVILPNLSKGAILV